MVKFAARLVSAFASGIVLGFLFYLIGVAAAAAITTLPPNTGIISFLVGFAGSVAVGISEDVSTEK